MANKDRIIDTALIIVQIAIVLNWIALAAITFGLGFSWVFPLSFANFLTQAAPDAAMPQLAISVRFELLIGIMTTIVAVWFFSSLLNILKSAREGEPFSKQTTNYLQTMAWALLGLQLLDIPAGISTYFIQGLPASASDNGISIGGWMAVLMLFVLARVFAKGAAMRDDLDGTI